MKTSVVTKEYLQLHKDMIQLQEKWKESLPLEAFQLNGDRTMIQSGVPVIAFTSFYFDFSLFLQWLDELTSLLVKNSEGLSGKLNRLNSIINEEIARRWIDEALAFNHLYFIGFAEEHQLDGWIPQFLAETLIRPYLQRIAEIAQDQVKDAIPGEGCPVCGEPVRVAQLEEEGKKVVHCPRCLAHWQESRLTCSHCGNHNHETLKFLTIEEDPASQIQVCEECYGYTKIIDTRQYLSKPSAALLDLTSIHLDFIAQENGYYAVGEKKQTN
ncbi:formate dehydrogenase accessory protein FdhE [Bacillota bacterium Lsc_1132]